MQKIGFDVQLLRRPKGIRGDLRDNDRWKDLCIFPSLFVHSFGILNTRI